MPGAQFGKRVASAKRNGGSHSAQSSPTKEGGNRHHNAYSSTQSFPLVAEAKQQQHQARDDGNDANGGGGPRVTTKTGRGGRGNAKANAAVEVECGSPVSPGTDSEDLHHMNQQEQDEHGASSNKVLALMTSSMTSSSSSTTNLSVFLAGESGSNDDELYSACEQGDVPAVRVESEKGCMK